MSGSKKALMVSTRQNDDAGRIGNAINPAIRTTAYGRTLPSCAEGWDSPVRTLRRVGITTKVLVSSLGAVDNFAPIESGGH